jgi:transcriptional regulator with XRE-family HTH domain
VNVTRVTVMEWNAMNFGEWTRIEMTKHGKTLSWLAKEIGANQSLVSRWRQGTVPRTAYFLKVIAVVSKLSGKPFDQVLKSGALSIGIVIDVD